MTCQAETPLYQLEFVVKSITRCSRQEDDRCGMAVCIRFLEYPEQTVCEIPASTCNKPDGVAPIVRVDRGKTYTFAMFNNGCGPRAVGVTIRLYRIMGKDILPGREELASGKLDVVPTRSSDGHRRRPATDSCNGEDEDNELTVPMTSSSDGRTVAVMTVLARAWCAGSMTATPVRMQSVTPPPTKTLATDCCTSGQPAPQPRPQVQIAQQHCKTVDNNCSRKKQQPVAMTKCCESQPPQRTCRRQCDQCLPARRPTGCSTAGIPAVANTTRQSQYTTVGCEIDGRKMDMLVRKKNYETCAVQRHITTEAEAFASRVMAVVREMHGFVSESVGAKADHYDT